MGEAINIDLSDPDEGERGTEMMRYLVGVNLTQPYPDDPLSLADHLETVVAPAYAELGGEAEIAEKVSLMAHTIQAAIREITELLMSAALEQLVRDDPEVADRVTSEDATERHEAITQVLEMRANLWRIRQLDRGGEAGA